MKRSVGAKRLDYEVSAGWTNLRYIARRVFIVSGRRHATCRTPKKNIACKADAVVISGGTCDQNCLRAP